MRTSALSVVLAAALLFQCYTGSMTAPMSGTEDDAFGDDEIAENTVGAVETTILGQNGGAKVIVVADSSLWKNLGANEGGLSLYKQNGLTLDRRDVPKEAQFTVIRKDAMRCMVGRVYRPCWELEQ